MNSGTKKIPSMAEREPRPLLQLNLREILRSRLSEKSFARIPGSLIRTLEKTICQDKLNWVLRMAWPREGADFAAESLKLLGVKFRAKGLDQIPEGRYVFASNHPLGGLDGLALIALITERFGKENLKFPVNDMLMYVTPLADVFTPLNKYGSQVRTGAQALNEAFASDAQIAIFPAGMVSRIQEDGSVGDLAWHKSFVVKALESKRGIVPVFVKALNRKRFYKAARWRKRLGIKVNLEQILLPSEVTHSDGMEIEVVFGHPIPYEELVREREKLTPARLAQRIRLLSEQLAIDS